MPYAVPKLCASCRIAHTGPCPRAAERRKAAWKHQDERRGTRSERGYDAAWRRFRAAYLDQVVALHPFCRDCGAFLRGVIELHHVKKVKDYPDLRLDPDNIMALCHDCHSRRTARGE